eukprot:gnl/TRDRNA2_/TRDRNA2_177663_c0_seq4.p1 gnl/TRDRNA2_/TRDRNA2_177663_c0~~gnl/TRDRNA2_/TRDRNA2_177663_c0_seq4.p1  ORF type:complete len:830 (+),score=226.87 gnl/TRDRNA2_/TRDRNA2_177663_c0_seq4:76-2565(+)
MMSMTNTLVLLALLGAASGAELNPVTQVIGLIDNLIAKVEKDGAAEDEAYSKFMVWCKEGKSDMELQIKSFIMEIEKEQACISKATATVTSSQTSITQLGGDIAHLEFELSEATEIHEKEHAEFLKQEKELLDAIDAIERAISIIERHMQGSALLQTKFLTRDVSNLLRGLDQILDALALSAADRQRLTQLIQQHSDDADDDKDLKEDEDRSLAQLSSSRPSGVLAGEHDDVGAPAGAVYKNEASHSILDLLEDLKDKAEEELSELRKEWANTCHSYELACISLKDEIAAYKKEFSELQVSVSTSSESMSTCEGDLSVSSETCTATMGSLADLLHSCMVAAQDHTTAVASRNEELEALSKAKTIIEASTGGAENAVYSAAAAGSFLQLRSSSMRLVSGADPRNFEVVKAVRQLAKKTKSANLMQLASKIAAAMRLGASSGDDPFEKVKGLIEDMIKKLEAKAAEEATHKEYCDREMGNTKDKKEELNAAIDELTTNIDKAESDIAILKQEISELQHDLAELMRLQKEMDDIRAEEKAAFAQHEKDVTAGIEGVRRALEVLRDHYNSAAVFVQIAQSSTAQKGSPPNVITTLPTDPRDPASASSSSSSSSSYSSSSFSSSVSSSSSSFSSSSSSVSSSSIAVNPPVQPPPVVNPPVPVCEIVGISTKPIIHIGESETNQGNNPDNSGAGASIISMLELIESDFSKSLAEAQTDEDAAQAEYDKTTMQNKLDKKQKESDVKRKGQQIVKLEHELTAMKSELRSKHSELSAVLEYWKTITAECVVQPESFEERMRRRQAEIDGLKEALRILTTETAMMQVPKGALRGVQRHR